MVSLTGRRQEFSLGLFLWWKVAPIKSVHGEVCGLSRVTVTFFYGSEQHKLNLIVVHCIGGDEANISKPMQIKPKLSAWLDTTGTK